MVEPYMVQSLSRHVGLRNAVIIQWNVGAALEQPLSVPVGDAMAEAKE
jgi:hypothetical protein